MQILIVLQYCENYAAARWDGTGQCPQGWKNKGGLDYVVQGVSEEEAPGFVDGTSPILQEVLQEICYDNDYAKAYLLSVTAHADDVVLGETWHTPIVLSKKDGKWQGYYVAKVDEYSLLPKFVVEERVTVSIDKGREQTTKREYLLDDGQVVDYRKVCEIVAARRTLVTPTFSPNLSFEGDFGIYQDGRVHGVVQPFQKEDVRGLIIHEWTSEYHGRGHTLEALRWLRKQYDCIAANGVGLIEDGVGDISTMYWLHMRKLGLADVLIDDNGMEIPTGQEA